MHTVSLFVEVLRTRPALVFWAATLAQALVWLLAPLILYSAPPGDLPIVVAVGHEFRLGSHFGPPLAFWLSEIAYSAAGLFGLYVLAQACVVVAFWTVFRLGAVLVGPAQSALAALAMVGISAFTIPTPEFGPAIAALPIWTLVLLHYWRAVGEGRALYFFVLAVDAALLLLASAAGGILLALLALFTLATRRGRAALAAVEPWLALLVGLAIVAPYAVWLWFAPEAPPLPRVPSIDPAKDAVAWLRLIGLVVAAHAGFVLLVVIGRGGFWSRATHTAVIARQPLDPFGKALVYCFALAPAVTATILAALMDRAVPLGGIAPLIILSSLAVIVAGGDSIRVHSQLALGYAWFGLLLAPPALIAAGLVLSPWVFPMELKVAQPATPIARFFAENFERRMNAPLAIVAGEPRIASLIAMRAPSRPSLYLDAAPARTPWVTLADIQTKGAIVVWPATDPRGALPAAFRERFGDVASDVPQSFERPVRGRLPLFRLGWSAIRPVQN